MGLPPDSAIVITPETPVTAHDDDASHPNHPRFFFGDRPNNAGLSSSSSSSSAASSNFHKLPLPQTAAAALSPVAGGTASPGPPPSPRRHAGGALLSRVRARSVVPIRTPPFSTDASSLRRAGSDDESSEERVGVSPSKSVGSLVGLGRRAQTAETDRSQEHTFDGPNNSARFYYQQSHAQPLATSPSSTLHPLPQPGSTSAKTEKKRPNSFSSVTFPPPQCTSENSAVAQLYGGHLAGGASQQHLVILTPTTQEWKDMRRASGEVGSHTGTGLRQGGGDEADSPVGVDVEESDADSDDNETHTSDEDGALAWSIKARNATLPPVSTSLTKTSSRESSTMSTRPSLARSRTVTVDAIPTFIESSPLLSPPPPAAPPAPPPPLASFSSGSWDRSSPGHLSAIWDRSGDTEPDAQDEEEEEESDDGGGGMIGRSRRERQAASSSSEGGALSLDLAGVSHVGALELGTPISAGGMGTSGVQQFGRGLGLGQMPSPRSEPSESEAEEEDPDRTFTQQQPKALPPHHHVPDLPASRSRHPSSHGLHLSHILQSHPQPHPLALTSTLNSSSSPSPSSASSPRQQLLSLPPSRRSSASSSPPPASHDLQSPPLSPRISRRRQSQKSQRVSLLAGRQLASPFGLAATPGLAGLSPFSPFPSVGGGSGSSTPSGGYPFPSTTGMPGGKKPSMGGLKLPPYLRDGERVESTLSVLSLAPSTGPPSDGEASPLHAPAIKGKSIDDYIIMSEAGRGAYGLVKRARRRGPDDEPVGPEVIIKMIIKQRILADSWKKHRILGPIPIEIHIMDQVSKFRYVPPPHGRPWDPSRPPPLSHSRPNEADLASTPGLVAPTGVTSEVKPEELPTTFTTEVDKSHHDDGATQPFPALETAPSGEKFMRGHPNVCTIIDFFEGREFYFLVMPRFGIGQDLFDHVEAAPTGLSAFEVRSLLGQIADGLAFLHGQGIIHRDIKDENVILDGEGHAQLIDFGSAAYWKPGRMWDTFSGTLDYASPEILRGEKYSGKEQDVWALGVVGYVLLCGETPFVSSEEAMVGFRAGSRAEQGLKERCLPHEGRAPGDALVDEEPIELDGGGALIDARDYVERCCEDKLEDRPTAEELLSHRFLAGRTGWVGHLGWLESKGEAVAESSSM